MLDEQKTAPGQETDDHFQPAESACCGLLPYLDKDDRQNLREYKYVGGDAGILYIHCWSPMATYLINGMPRWIAPNMITIIGFMFTIGPFIWLFVAYGT